MEGHDFQLPLGMIGSGRAGKFFKGLYSKKSCIRQFKTNLDLYFLLKNILLYLE